jgi:uncharacterized caspase-like protein
MFDRLSQFLRMGVWGAIIAALLPFAAEAAGRKLALVVGNQSYETLPRLNTPLADATAVSQALRDVGFEVTLLTDVRPEVFQAVLGTFAGQADASDTVLFYYSGHAFQKAGINHLVPVTAKLADKAALDSETWRLDDIAKALKGNGAELLLFLDACRDNPLPEGLRSDAGGLAQFDGGAGTFVAFATAPGQVAWDKTEGSRNSPFTAALLAHLATPGQAISDLMIKVRNDVTQATAEKQTPWEQSSLRAQFFFVPEVKQADDALPAFEFVDQDTAIAPPQVAVVGQGVAGDQLAMLETDTRSLNQTLPDNLPLAVQGELKRIGCYGSKVDGSWGKGSRGAMAAYYAAKKMDPGEVEPTETVWRSLQAEPAAVCTEAVKAPAKAPAKVAKKADTKKTAPKKAATKKAGTTYKKPAAAPAKKEPHCKFMVIAVVCS